MNSPTVLLLTRILPKHANNFRGFEILTLKRHLVIDMSKTSDAESSPHKSSRSSTPDSTSTYRYAHEPFDTFCGKVRALASDLKAESIEDIVRLPGGSFNRIIAATLYRHDPAAAAEKVVLRIPRFAEDGDSPNEDIRTQYAILETLNDSSIQTPRVLAYDCNSDNAIGIPFSLQTRFQGQGLDSVYPELTLTERLSMASELVRILVAVENKHFQKSGRVCCSPAVPARKTVEDAVTSTPSQNILIQGFGVGIGQPESKTKTRTASSLQELLSTQLDAWVKHELLSPRRSFVVDMFRRLKKIFTEMEELGFFQERPSLDSNALYHWDLEPRNIMVDRRATGCTSDITTSHRLDVTGVLDWDDVLVIPAILARKPPVWLWDFSEDENLPSPILAYYDGDVDLLPLELYNGASNHLSEEDLQVKQFFETEITDQLYGGSSHASQEAYLDDAYGRGRWLRRLWRFALEGFSDSQHIDRFKNFDKAWSEYKETSSSV